MIIAVNNVSHEAHINVEAHHDSYIALLSGKKVSSNGGRLDITLLGNSGEIFAPEGALDKKEETITNVLPIEEPKKKPEPKETPKEEAQAGSKAETKKESKPEPAPGEVLIPEGVPYSEMSVEQLQQVILISK